MAQQLFHLSRDGVSLLIETTKGTPNIIHWGRQLPAIDDPSQYLTAITEPTPHGLFDESHRGGAWRENARAFLGQPALQGHRAGRAFSQKFELVRIDAPTAHSLEFVSRDEHAELEVTLAYEITESGLVKITPRVTNLATSAFNLDGLMAFLPLPDYATDILDFHGRWMRERQSQRTKISVGKHVRESHEGRTGHDYTIVQFATTDNASFQNGEVWGLSLAWSGNNVHSIEREMVGRTQIGAGELLLPGEIILAAGETHAAPTVIATYSNQGIDGASDRLHRYQRARKGHPTNIRPRPVSLNVWEAVYMNHDLTKLTALAEVAGRIGVERFVLDDGWFGARRDDTAGLGDWVVSKDVWPNGLKPLIDVVKANGMEFGLWFEAEMVNPNSDLYRAHPEWIMQAGERTPVEARWQQVLDLTHPGAYEHVLSQVDALLGEYEISYIKWDHNRPITDAGHFDRAAVRAQTQAIYRLFDELKSRHPGLEIESCASGGGRIDLGMIHHADRFWASDNNDALERQSIYRNTSIAIAPELLGTHIGPTKAHSSGRTHSLSFRAATAIWGHAGIEWDVTEASELELEQLAGFVSFYKANRDLLHSGRVVRVDAIDENAWSHGVVAQDGSRAIFAYVQLRTAKQILPNAMRFAGLEPQATYRVCQVEPAGAPGKMQKFDSATWIDGVELSGAWLMSSGLRTPILQPEQAMIFEVVRL